MTARGTLLSIVRYWTERNPDYPQTAEAIVDDYRAEVLDEAVDTALDEDRVGRRTARDGGLMSVDGYSEPVPPGDLELEDGDECLVRVRATWTGTTWALSDGSNLRTIHVVDVQYKLPGAVE